MNQTLKKLSENHYIIYDDSEIQENIKAYNSTFGIGEIKLIYNELCYVSKHESGGTLTTPYKRNLGEDCKKITHSFGKQLEGVENRPLSEVEELLLGYDVENSATEYSKNYSQEVGRKYGYMNGFYKAMELKKDKLFTVEEMEQIFGLGAANNATGTPSFQEAIQSLQPTEWKIKINEQNKLELV